MRYALIALLLTGCATTPEESRRWADALEGMGRDMQRNSRPAWPIANPSAPPISTYRPNLPDPILTPRAPQEYERPRQYPREYPRDNRRDNPRDYPTQY